MAEYIEREKAIAALIEWETDPLDEEIEYTLKSIPAADVVPKGAYDQVAWERDVAIEQLREDYGVGLGEKKRADVVEVVRCRDCVSHGNCLTEDTFNIARIENPYCCGGKRRESNG